MPKYISQPDSVIFSKPLIVDNVVKTSKAADTDYFTSNITASVGKKYRIYIRLASESKAKLSVDDGTNTNEVYALNDDTALAANNIYAFDVQFPAGFSFNVQHFTATQNVDCWVLEGGQD